MNPEWFVWAESVISHGTYLAILVICAVDLLVRLMKTVLK